MITSPQLKVRNWAEFQHYKDRNPPWIKLHFALLASEDWVTLDDASKLLAVVCMLVASRNNGMVPNNPAYLKRVAYLDRLPKLKPLIDCGFLEMAQADASERLADASAPQADARPETETDTEKKDSPSPRGKRVAVNAEIEAEFEGAFWPLYPRKVDKRDARKAFLKARATVPLETILSALKAYVAEVEGKEKQFIRHPTRWLNAASWEDGSGSDAPLVITEDAWRKRLIYGRTHQRWHVEAWGPFPGDDGCRAPEHLLQPEDGHGWAVWEG